MNEHFALRLGEARVELVRQPDFELAGLRVRPSTCEVISGGEAHRLEPRIMQVLVALTRAQGQVLSREDLINSCWSGRVVGEDAVNRCIGRLRRLFETTGAPVSISTIARVGFRLDVDDVPVGEDAGKAPPRRRIGRRSLAAAAAAAIVAAALVFGFRTLGQPARWTVADYRPFAAETLIERHPAFSPDGRSIAYSAGADVLSRRILLRGVDGGATATLSRGPGDEYAPAFSRDGDRIAWARYVPGQPCRIVAMRLPAGPAAVVGRCRHDERTRIAWSVSGAEIYFTDSPGGQAGSQVLALALASGQTRVLTRPDAAAGESDSEPALSPDGRRLAFLRTPALGAPRLTMLDLASGRIAQVRTHGVTPGGAAWTPDGRSLVVASDRGGDFSLWLVPLARGSAPQRLLIGLRALGRVAVSSRGQVAVETENDRVNLERLGGTGGVIAPANSSDWSPDFAPDGSVAFISNRGGGQAVWVLRPGQRPAPVTTLDFDRIYGVRWSPDGRQIAFAGARQGAAGLYVASAEGLGLARLSAAARDFGAPSWTADGQALIAPARERTGWRLLRAPLDPKAAATPTPDDGWVSVRREGDSLYGVRADAPGVWRIRADGRRQRVADGASAAYPEDWAVFGGKVFVFRRTARNDGDLYVSPASGGPARLEGRFTGVSEEPGLAVDPVSGLPAAPRVITEDSDIGLMTLKRSR